MAGEVERFNSVKEFITIYKIPLIFGGAGCVFLLVAIVVAWLPGRSRPSSLTFTSSDANEATVAGSAQRLRPAGALAKELVIDIQGAVMSPGVYKLPEGSRVADLLEKAGGLSDDANSDWVAKNLNKAQKLVDGAKLYIPTTSEFSNSNFQTPNNDQFSNSNGKININTASSSELESLDWIGEKTAEKIISGRPYGTIEELVQKKIVFQSTFEKIKEQITVLGN